MTVSLGRGWNARGLSAGTVYGKNMLSNVVLLVYMIFIISINGSTVTAIDREEWYVQVTGDPQLAEETAKKNGFTSFGQIGNLQNYYRFVRDKPEHDDTNEIHKKLNAIDEVVEFQYQEKRKRFKKLFKVPSDPKWNNQWSLYNVGQTQGPSKLDLNVEKAWLQNITGNGILVGVVDCGVQWSNNDIKDNYNPGASYNFVDNTNDPSPNVTQEEAGHGTSCAGEIAMVRNDKCGVGVAYRSNIAGLRIGLSEGLTDSEEASALGHKHDDIPVYSNSWGPSDAGFIFEGPGPLLSKSFEVGATKGRGGKGSIYVWAAGNGGEYHDSCAADGYVNSIYTIAVGSADQNGHQAIYDENCTAKMAVTYSFNSDHFTEYDTSKQITTIDLGDQCIDTFTGTSSSAPLVSGTIALVFERNPNLSWRDIQYLIVYTSDTTKLDGEWTTNGAGLKVNSMFGFGAIDAEAIVTRAKYWSNVPEQLHDEFSEYIDDYVDISDDLIYTFELTSDNTSITYLEHVVLTVNLSMSIPGKKISIFDGTCDLPDNGRGYNYELTACDLADLWPDRGDLSIMLKSPFGTKSQLLPNRKCDICQNGLTEWSFMSVQYWGESPIGTWEVVVQYDGHDGSFETDGIQSFGIFGTQNTPQSVKRIPDKCDSLCVRGCAASGKQYCDSCKQYRDPVSLECTKSCNKVAYNGYCLDHNPVVTPDGSSFHLPTIGAIAIVMGVCCLLVIAVIVIVWVVLKIKAKRRRRGYSELVAQT